MNRLQGELATGSALEKNCCVAGGAGSLLAGAMFLVAACIYWSRWRAEPPGGGRRLEKLEAHSMRAATRLDLNG